MNAGELMEMRRSVEGARVVCFFGVGALLEECYGQLVAVLGREPDFLCDNAPGKWGSDVFGRKCVPPDELGRIGPGVVVIVTVSNHDAICRQLCEMGVGDVFVVCYGRGYDFVRSVKRPEKMPARTDGLLSARGKWTLVTGASRGVGRQLALAMAGKGANIIAHARSTQNLKGTVEDCAALGVEAVPVAAELGDSSQLDAMLDRVEQEAPQVDIVFNSAGVSPPCPEGFWAMPDEHYLESFRVNAMAPIHICRRLAPGMMRRGFGRVVNVSSSIRKRPGEMAYACGKAALDKFVSDLAPSLQGSGVMISLLDPGWLRTDMGGADAPHPVESVLPGALLGALLDADVNGRWFGAQDYAGLSLEEASRKARFLLDI